MKKALLCLVTLCKDEDYIKKEIILMKDYAQRNSLKEDNILLASYDGEEICESDLEKIDSILKENPEIENMAFVYNEANCLPVSKTAIDYAKQGYDVRYILP